MLNWITGLGLKRTTQDLKGKKESSMITAHWQTNPEGLRQKGYVQQLTSQINYCIHKEIILERLQRNTKTNWQQDRGAHGRNTPEDEMTAPG